MTLEQFQKYQKESFDAFCKSVIRNESAKAHAKLNYRAEIESTFSDLSDAELNLFHTFDDYHPYCKTFPVREYTVHVYDPTLGEILQHLSPQRRDVLLMGYFLGFNDNQISKLLHIDHKTVDYRRTEGLRRLKELLEDMEDA